MIFNLPHGENIEIKTLVLDLNGTLTVHGKVPEGVHEQIDQLRNLGFRIVLLSGDVRGTAKDIAEKIRIELIIAKSADEKEEAILKLEPQTCASIGNARIDIGTFKHARVSILTLQAEGIHAETIQYADIIVPSIQDALSLFIDKKSFEATMRK
jgi:P-type E1-E2 ATPase